MASLPQMGVRMACQWLPYPTLAHGPAPSPVPFFVDGPTGLNLMYYILYWVIVAAVMLWKNYHGTLTDKRQAGAEDLKSFVHHLGDVETGLGEFPAGMVL